jgi:hypothetical protein
MFSGANLSIADIRSCITPDSNSMVVMDAVDPGMKMLAMPVPIPLLSSIFTAIGVISCIVENEATEATFNTQTSSAGLYSFPNLLIGQYTVTVELDGFKKYIRRNVQISANEVIDVDVTLEIGDVSTIIEIVGGAELVSLTNSQIGTTIETKPVQDLPNSVLGGSPLNLAITLPNTTTQAGGVLGEGGAIGGNRPRNNNFTIDGVDNNYVSVTGSLQPVIQDAVAEFNFISNQFSAE